MKKLFLVLGTLILVGLLNATAICAKHSTDGNLTDWGLNALKNNASWGVNSTWLPNAGVQFIVKDNYNPNAGGSYVPGVHIQGTGSSYSFYNDPQVAYQDGTLVWEPYGGEHYNIEALYFDQDAGCLYLTVITSVPPDAQGDAAPGDLAMNLDGNINTGKWGYEYGVKLESYHAPLNLSGLYYLPDWQQPPYIPLDRPSYFTSGNYIGQVKEAYTELKDGNGNGVYDVGDSSGNAYPNYVIQVAIPKSMVGMIGGANATISDFHLASYCGNDHVPAPEFPMLLIPVGIAIVAPLFGYFLASRKGKAG